MNLPPPTSPESASSEGDGPVELVMLCHSPEWQPAPRQLEIYARAIHGRFAAVMPHPDIMPEDRRRGARQEAVVYTLVKCGVLQNQIGQLRRLTQLYPVVEAVAVAKPIDQQEALIKEASQTLASPVLRTFDEFSKLSHNYEDGYLMQVTAAFFITRFSEPAASAPEISQL